MSKKKNKCKKNEKLSINLIGIIIILAGVVVMAIMVGINSCIDEELWLWDFVYSFIINLAMTTVTIGAGTVLYSYFDFVNYICNNLKNIILEYKFIKNLNNDQKEDLLNKLSKDLIYDDENSPNDTLYCFVNNEIKELTKSIYYEQLYLNINCSCIDGKIIKDIVRIFTINYENTPCGYEFDLKRITNTSFVKDSNIPKPIEVTLLKINGKELTKNIEYRKEEQLKFNQYQENCYYDFKEDYKFKQDEFLKDGKKVLRIELHYQTIVPEEDNTMGFRVYAPCKSFEADFVYDHTISDTFCDAFAFKDRKANDRKMDEDRIDYIRNKNSVCVKIEDWILPGDGVIYVITPRNNEK